MNYAFFFNGVMGYSMEQVSLQFCWLEAEKSADLGLPFYQSELASGMDVAAAVRLLLTVFPDVEPDTVAKDVKALLHDLADHRLISVVGS